MKATSEDDIVASRRRIRVAGYLTDEGQARAGHGDTTTMYLLETCKPEDF